MDLAQPIILAGIITNSMGPFPCQIPSTPIQTQMPVTLAFRSVNIPSITPSCSGPALGAPSPRALTPARSHQALFGPPASSTSTAGHSS